MSIALEPLYSVRASLHSSVAGGLDLGEVRTELSAEFVPTFFARGAPPAATPKAGGLGQDLPALLFGSTGADGALRVGEHLSLELDAQAGFISLSLIGPFRRSPDLLDETDPQFFFFGYQRGDGWLVERQDRATSLMVHARGSGELADVWPERPSLTYEAQS